MKAVNTMVKVNFIFRKPQDSYYSVERVFNEVKNNLPATVTYYDVYLPFYSRGIVDRIKNIFFCRKLTAEINHITGDVNYLATFLNSENTVLTILDCVYRFNTRGLKRWFIWFFWYFLPARKCVHLTAISEFSKQEVIRVTRVAAERIKVIYVALPEGFYPVSKQFNSENPVILHVGNTPNKNLNNLIKGLKGVPCELWIVGKLNGENKGNLADCAINFKNFVGISDSDLIELYKKCDIVSFISLYEGFGMPIIEGQAIGRPVIISNCGSLPEVAGNAAMVIDEPKNPAAIGKAFKKVISDSLLREELVKKGFENIKRFDAKKLALQYEQLYLEISTQKKRIE